MHFFFPCRYPKKALDNYTFVTQSTRCSRRFALKGKPSCCLKDLLDPSVGLRGRLEVFPSSDSLGHCLRSLVSHNTLEGNKLTCWKAFYQLCLFGWKSFLLSNITTATCLSLVYLFLLCQLFLRFFVILQIAFKANKNNLWLNWINSYWMVSRHGRNFVLNIERIEFLFLPTGAFLRSGKVSLSTFREISLKNPFEQIAQL